MNIDNEKIDVLCVGHACYDLVFSVDTHPQSDEKIFANHLAACGGGPAANAAIAVSRLGLKSAFAGYLGYDLYGDTHLQEFLAEQVDTSLLIRGDSPTPLSTVIVKPDGKRALINFKGDTKTLVVGDLDIHKVSTKVILFDGHEPAISLQLIKFAKEQGIVTVLDAGSLHEGTSMLWNQVDYLVASEKFALQFASSSESALAILSEQSPAVVITLGEKGLIWQNQFSTGMLPAYTVSAIDTTGAGDSFHAAFAAAISQHYSWNETLQYASAAGSLCCTKLGARTGLPRADEIAAFINANQQGTIG